MPGKKTKKERRMRTILLVKTFAANPLPTEASKGRISPHEKKEPFFSPLQKGRKPWTPLSPTTNKGRGSILLRKSGCPAERNAGGRRGRGSQSRQRGELRRFKKQLKKPRRKKRSQGERCARLLGESKEEQGLKKKKEKKKGGLGRSRASEKGKGERGGARTFAKKPIFTKRSSVGGEEGGGSYMLSHHAEKKIRSTPFCNERWPENGGHLGGGKE